jgi:Mrp family chromosome partitioning ATPase
MGTSEGASAERGRARSLRQAGVGPSLRRAWIVLLLLAVAGAVAGGVWALIRPGFFAGLGLTLTGPLLWSVVAAASAGVGLSLGAALVAATAPRRVKAAIPVQSEIGVDGSVLAVVPALTSRELRQVAPDLRDPPGLVVSAPESLFAQCARGVAERMAKWRAGEAGMSVAFIAAAPREGASAMALAVARSLALAGRKVVLVDADARNRTASSLLEMTEGRGLWTLLDALAQGQSVGLEMHLAPDPYTGLAVLPQSDGWSPVREVYGHAHFASVLETLKRQYDHVIVDCSPVGLVDGRMTAAQADAVVIVTRWDATLARHLSIARQGLEELGGVLPGVIVNGASDAAVRRWLAKHDHHAAPK